MKKFKSFNYWLAAASPGSGITQLTVVTIQKSKFGRAGLKTLPSAVVKSISRIAGGHP